MIERLARGIRVLAAMPADELSSGSATALLRDTADALRLELDCPQMELTDHQRGALTALSDLLEDPSSGGCAIAERARIALRVLES